MEKLFTLLFRLALVYCVSCGLLPSFSVKEEKLRLDDSATDTSVSTLAPQNSATTTLQSTSDVDNLDITIIDQLVVPRAAIANSSDPILSETYRALVSNTSVEANQVTTTCSTPATTKAVEDDEEKKVQDEIVVPKEAINNATLAAIATTSALSSSTSNLNASIENAIVVPKTAIANNNNNMNINVSATNDSKVSPAVTAATVAADTVEPNQAGLGPISVHKRSIDFTEESEDTSSLLFEKYDKWTGPGAITSQEIRELKNKGKWFEQSTPRNRRNHSNQAERRKRRRRKRREATEDEAATWTVVDNWDSSDSFERGEVESTEDETFRDTLMNALAESNSRENMTVSTDSNQTSNNTSDTTIKENLANVNQQHLKEDVVDDDDSVCAVNKDDEEATRVVTIFWRSVFCVIFVIIVVYPIYSYTKIYCLKRRKYADSISNDRFVGSDSEISTTTNDYPTPMTPTPTPTSTAK